MFSWEQSISNVLHLFRLDSIRSKVLVFALLSILIPSVTLGWRSYVVNKQFVTEKISEDLRGATVHAVRELNLWLKERFYEMRVFSSSYEVTENLEKVLGAPAAPARGTDSQRRLTDYLTSVRGKFRDYEELMVVAPDGRVLFTSADQAIPPKLPPDWSKQAQADASMVGETYWDDARKKGVIAVAVPIRAVSGRFLGVMAAKLNFATVEELLRSVSFGATGQVYLVTPDGVVIVASRPTAADFMKAKLPAKAAQALFRSEGISLEFENYEGHGVIGVLKPLAPLGWGAVAEIGRQEAYAQTARIRDLTVVTVVGLLLGIGLTAYLLVLTIVRPLDRLTGAATEVTAGDLKVDVPVVGHGEVRHMTEVFNHMVARLRQGREELDAINAALNQKNLELQELSIRDGLTGLYNRKHLMETLATEVARAGRLKHPLSVLMVDIDRFKNYNDTHGHLAGDALLSKIASIFKDATRSIDYVARYGGEEFLIILHEVGSEGAVRAAERVRTGVAEEKFGAGGERVTVSIGVAVFPEHGGTPEALVARADAMLYEAKRSGRNRVALAGGDPRPAATA